MRYRHINPAELVTDMPWLAGDGPEPYMDPDDDAWRAKAEADAAQRAKNGTLCLEPEGGIPARYDNRMWEFGDYFTWPKVAV